MIKLLTHTDLPATLAYMNKHYLETAFLLGNVLAYGLENRWEDGRSGDYFGYFEGADLKGVIGFYNSASCIPHYESLTAVDELSRLMARRNFKTLLGLQNIISPFLPKLQERRVIREIVKSEYLVNLSIKPYLFEGGQFLTASELGEGKAAKFIAKTYRLGYNDAKIQYEVRKLLHEQTGSEEFLFLLVEGDIKAQAYIRTSTAKVAQIGGVYTLEAERGRGYCKAITSELCGRSMRLGKTPTLIVHKDNLPARKAYEHVGFDRYDDYLIIKC